MRNFRVYRVARTALVIAVVAWRYFWLQILNGVSHRLAPGERVIANALLAALTRSISRSQASLAASRY